MRKALLQLLAMLLLVGVAYADEDLWDDDAVIEDNNVVAVETTPTDISASGPHYINNPGALGMYFGTGDDIVGRDVVYVDGRPHTSSPRAAMHGGSTYYDEAVYYPSHGSSAYDYENVYGPLWGVPSDAVGMDGYDAYYYYQLYQIGQGGGELTPKQRRELEAAEAGRQKHDPDSAASSEEYVDTAEGLDITADDYDF